MQQEQLDGYAQSMRIELEEMALMSAKVGTGGPEAAIGIGQALPSQLQSTKTVGRLVINLKTEIDAKPSSSHELILRDGGELIVLKKRQEVVVLGEVQDTTSPLYHPAVSRGDYIQQSGGLTRQADRLAYAGVGFYSV